MGAAFMTSVRREADLGRYLTQILKLPMLAPEQEVSLARRWRDHGDLAAAHELMTSHLRLVAKIAMGYSGYGLPLNELIAEGNIGLMQSVKRFDPERGFRLATYAMWWIRAAMQQYILHNWSLVKLGTTGAQKKLFFNLRRLKARMQAIDEGDLPPETVRKIATELDVAEADVVDMNRRLAGPDHSLNTNPSPDGEGERQDWLADEVDDQEVRLAQREELGLRRKLLNCAIGRLNERERHIVSERHLRDRPATLEDLSQRYNISRERVRQIETRALGKLRDAMHKLASTRVGPLTIGARAVA
jgi:RNA polymerase sigma-32 factor